RRHTRFSRDWSSDVCSSDLDQGNTVLVIEHNTDVIQSCDWLIDLGPDGGRHGGQIVAEGTPEALIKNKSSETGRFLKQRAEFLRSEERRVGTECGSRSGRYQ